MSVGARASKNRIGLALRDGEWHDFSLDYEEFIVGFSVIERNGMGRAGTPKPEPRYRKKKPTGLGLSFQAVRKQVNRTQKLLAEELGIARNTVARWESGVLPIPKWAWLLLAFMLNDVAYLETIRTADPREFSVKRRIAGIVSASIRWKKT